jgi:methyl-accepting chemotaxis protein
MPSEVIVSIIYAVVFIVAVAFLYRVFEKRLGEISRRMDDTPAMLQDRFEKGLAEIRAHIGNVQHTMAAEFNDRIEARLAEFEKRLGAVMESAEKNTRADDDFSRKIQAFHERLQGFKQEFHDYQESTRTSLERSFEAMERRLSRAAASEPQEDMDKIGRFKAEMPHYEERFGELADRHREVSANAKRILDQHKALSGKIAGAKSEEELKEFLRQSASLFQNLGRAINSSRDLFIGGEEALRQLIQEMSPLYKVCEICNEVHDNLSVCLNCGRKYCDECKGLQIGHCKECAPYVKPLHFEVRET